MPYTHTIDPEHQLVTIQGSGVGGLDEVEEHFEQLVRDPQLRPEYDLLIRVGGASHTLMIEDVKAFTALFRQLRYYHQGRIALVDSRPGQRTSNELIALASRDMRVFSNEGAARGWLGVPPLSG